MCAESTRTTLLPAVPPAHPQGIFQDLDGSLMAAAGVSTASPGGMPLASGGTLHANFANGLLLNSSVCVPYPGGEGAACRPDQVFR